MNTETKKDTNIDYEAELDKAYRDFTESYYELFRMKPVSGATGEQIKPVKGIEGSGSDGSSDHSDSSNEDMMPAWDKESAIQFYNKYESIFRNFGLHMESKSIYAHAVYGLASQVVKRIEQYTKVRSIYGKGKN